MSWNITLSDLYPITVKDAKLTARVDHDVEDRLFQRLIAAATMACEAYIGQKIMAQTYVASFTDTNVVLEVKLPNEYLSHTVRYLDEDGNELSQVEANVTVEIIDDHFEISYNQTVTVELTVLVGMYDDPSQVDPRIKMGLELLVEDYYANRSANAGLPKPVKTLWFPLKKVSA